MEEVKPDLADTFETYQATRTTVLTQANARTASTSKQARRHTAQTVHRTA